MDEFVSVLNILIDYVGLSEGSLNKTKIKRHLRSHGISEKEVVEVLEFLCDGDFKGIRYFSNFEKAYCSRETQNYLMKMQYNNVLNPLRLDHVINEIIESEVDGNDIEQVRQIIILSLLEKKDKFENISLTDINFN